MKTKTFQPSKLSKTELELKLWKGERFNKLREAYLSYMLQNIRTQMNNITGFSKLLAEEDSDAEKRARYYSQIEASTESLSELLNESLDIAKLSMEKIDVQKEPCMLNQLMDDLYEYFSQQKKVYSKAYVELYQYSDVEDEDFTVLTDCGRIRQIMAQLIGNSLAKCSDGDELEFGFRLLNDGKKRLLLFVEDNATEYTKEEVDKLLKQPELYKESLRQDLNLESVDFLVLQTLIDVLDGEMDIITGEEKGIRYEIALPYNPGENQKKEDDIESDPSVKEIEELQKSFQWKGCKVLIAEDVESNYLMLESALEETQAEVFHASNGKEAVELFEKNPDIDIILMDIKMPVMDGLEATRKIKEQNPEVPIIAQTAFVVDFERTDAIKAGCDDYISKPINFEVLFKMMDLYLKNLL
ncbi:MAG: response regulator [Bacteroidales bacterium]